LPRVGDVINYAFLFGHERAAGLYEGKVRPVLVMAVVDRRVTVMALTTKGDPSRSGTIAIPDDVARAMGLPAARTSLVPDALNRFEWVGFDLRPRGPGRDHRFGRCPPGFFAKALAAIGPGAVPLRRDE
jgi:hypothetical protein